MFIVPDSYVQPRHEHNKVNLDANGTRVHQLFNPFHSVFQMYQ